MWHNYVLKELKFTHGAQTIDYSALKISEYVSNMAKTSKKTNTVLD